MSQGVQTRVLVCLATLLIIAKAHADISSFSFIGFETTTASQVPLLTGYCDAGQPTFENPGCIQLCSVPEQIGNIYVNFAWLANSCNKSITAQYLCRDVTTNILKLLRNSVEVKPYDFLNLTNGVNNNCSRNAFFLLLAA